jgi:hypothetical protein
MLVVALMVIACTLMGTPIAMYAIPMLMGMMMRTQKLNATTVAKERLSI